MKPSELKNQMKNKSFQPCYIMAGEEVQVRDIYIDKIVEMSGKQRVNAESVKDIYPELRKKSMLGGSKVFVVRNDFEFAEDEKLWKITNDSIIGDNMVILVFSMLDKRKKFYKNFKDDICEFEPLDDRILIKYIKKEIDLSEKNCRALIEICEKSYARILLEIDKMKSFQQKIDMKADCIFSDFLESGLLYRPARDCIFEFVDACMSRKCKKAFDLMQESFESGEASLVMISVLYNNVKQTLQLKTCDSKDVSKSTRLTGWQIKYVSPYVSKWQVWELLDAMEILRKCEVGIKTGKIEDAMAVSYALVNIF